MFGSDYEEGTNQKEVIGTKYFSRPTDLLRSVAQKIDQILLEYDGDSMFSHQCSHYYNHRYGLPRSD